MGAFDRAARGSAVTVWLIRVGPTAWLLVAAALALIGDGRAGRRRARRPAGRLRRVDALPWLGGAGVAVVCLVLAGWPRGAVLGAVGAPVVGRLVAIAQRRAAVVAVDPALPLALDLAAAALRAGQPVAAALGLAAPAAQAHAPALERVAVLLRLGADPVEAWRAVAREPLARLARTAVRSSSSGVRLAGAFEAVAREMRSELRASAVRRAQRCGVAVLAPLGLCFLPAFVCLGIVPVVVGIARSALGAMP